MKTQATTDEVSKWLWPSSQDPIYINRCGAGSPPSRAQFADSSFQTIVEKVGRASWNLTLLQWTLFTDSNECRREKEIIPHLKVCNISSRRPLDKDTGNIRNTESRTWTELRIHDGLSSEHLLPTPHKLFLPLNNLNQGTITAHKHQH